MRLFFLTIALATLSLSAVDYYVAPDGSDSQAGSLTEPFRSIAHAVKRMGAGDTCYVRGGLYNETINLSGKAGRKGAPITIQAYEDEQVILDGTFPISTDWVLDEGSVYKTKLDRDITQLFVDSKLMTLARHPNVKVFSEEMWHRNHYRCNKTRESINGNVITDPNSPRGITELPGSLNGCVALLNFGAHSTATRLVENHVAGGTSFTYDPPLMKYKTTTNFFLEGGKGNAERVLLDAEEEWAFDETTKTLYLWADNGADPTGRMVRGKVQDYAVTGDASTQHVVIDGLNFVATTFSFHSSDHITVQNCHFTYYAASKRALGIGGFSETAEFVGTEEDTCAHITLYNNEFKYADASGLKANYCETLRIENNLFSNIDYASANNDNGPKEPFTPCSSIRVNKVQDYLYRRNTLSISGNAQGMSANRVVENTQKAYRENEYDAAGTRNIVCEYNYHTRCGLQHTDGASLYIPEAHVQESVIRYNWFVGNGQRDFRWDGDNRRLNGVHGNLYRNVAHCTGGKKMSPSGGNGFRVKGSYHEVYHNSGIGRGAELNIATEKGKNEHTITRNNAASHFTDYPIPGIHSHNYVQSKKNTPFRDLLRDPANNDYRPKKTAAELIDQGTPVTCSIRGKKVEVNKHYNGKAPDLGAYEYGDKVYWIPGRQEAGASMPVPKDGGINVPVDADLMYLIGLDGTTATIHLGTSAETLTQIGERTHPENIVPIPTDTPLEAGKTYYWRVDTQRVDGEVIEGKVWAFTTEEGL